MTYHLWTCRNCETSVTRKNENWIFTCPVCQKRMKKTGKSNQEPLTTGIKGTIVERNKKGQFKAENSSKKDQMMRVTKEEKDLVNHIRSSEEIRARLDVAIDRLKTIDFNCTIEYIQQDVENNMIIVVEATKEKIEELLLNTAVIDVEYY